MAPQLLGVFINNLSDDKITLSKPVEDIKFGLHNQY